MINKFLKTIGSILLVGIFLFIAFGSGSDSDEKIKIDINDTKALENYMQGKWSLEKHTGDINHTWRYRFEIKGNKLRIWRCWNNIDDPFDMSDGYEEFNFTLGSPTRDIDGYHARNLEFALFDKTNNFGGVYNSLSPFWIVSDDHWDTPVLRCASGIPTWSKEEFQVAGNRITHNKYNTSESNYSTSNNYEDNSNEIQYPNIESDSTNREDLNDMSSNIKSADELEVADKKLNAIYKKVMAILNETEKTELRHEQRKWIKYRDVSCDEETKDMKGSLYNAFFNNCEKEKTEKRIEELNDILQSKQ
ncbi:lysozyme inhibitor LprI family protein [Flavobacterium sp. LB1P71]|uniref:lysozyme inhibitor LprI family protein n=1 Tax=Flavobacterium sp. LB1P71 TaxID=3401716 RepID=UPI003AAFD6C1